MITWNGSAGLNLYAATQAGAQDAVVMTYSNGQYSADVADTFSVFNRVGGSPGIGDPQYTIPLASVLASAGGTLPVAKVMVSAGGSLSPANVLDTAVGAGGTFDVTNVENTDRPAPFGQLGIS